MRKRNIKIAICLLLVLSMTYLLAACKNADEGPEEALETAKAADAERGTPETADKDNAALAEPSADGDAATAQNASGKSQLTIGMSWANRDTEFHQAMGELLEQAFEEAGENEGFEANWIHAVCNKDVQKQAADIEDLITKGVDCIVLYAQDSQAIHASIESAHAAGIPVICYDRAASADGEQPDLTIGLDTTEQAYTAAAALFEKMKQDGTEAEDVKVIDLIGEISDENAINRKNGFERAAKEYGVTPLQDVPSDWNEDTALANLTASLTANPDVNAVFVASDFLMTSVQTALEKVGKWAPMGEENHVYIGAQDCYPIALPLLRDGYMEYNTVNDLWAVAQECAPLIWDLIQGKELAEKKVLVQGRVVSFENVDTIENLWSRDYE